MDQKFDDIVPRLGACMNVPLLDHHIMYVRLPELAVESLYTCTP